MMSYVAWAIDKRLRVISTKKMLDKNSKSTKEINNKVLNLKQYCIRCRDASILPENYWHNRNTKATSKILA